MKNGELHSTAYLYRRLWSKSQTTYFTHIWLNYFSRADGVPKAIENTWKFVVFIVLYLILCFARSLAYYNAHTTDTYGNFCYEYFDCFLCAMSDLNVLRKLFETRAITFNSPLISASVE